MPITVVCSSCKARLNAPDKLAGKKIKCPKCQKLLLVPTPLDDEKTEILHETAPAVKPKAKPRPPASKPPVADDEDTEAPPPKKAKAPRYEDVEEDDEPKKKKPRKEKKKSALPAILIGCGGLLVVGVIVVVLILLLWPWGGPTPPTLARTEPTKPQPPTAINWIPYDDPEFFFRAAFPNVQATHADPFAGNSPLADAIKTTPLLQGGKGRSLAMTDAGRKYELMAFVLPVAAGVPGQVLLDGMKDLLASMYAGFTIEPRAKITLAGHPGQDFTLKRGGQVKLLRAVIADGTIFFVAVEGGQDLTPEDATGKEYFTRFVATRPAEPPK